MSRNSVKLAIYKSIVELYQDSPVELKRWIEGKLGIPQEEATKYLVSVLIDLTPEVLAKVAAGCCKQLFESNAGLLVAQVKEGFGANSAKPGLLALVNAIFELTHKQGKPASVEPALANDFLLEMAARNLLTTEQKPGIFYTRFIAGQLTSLREDYAHARPRVKALFSTDLIRKNYPNPLALYLTPAQNLWLHSPTAIEAIARTIDDLNSFRGFKTALSANVNVFLEPRYGTSERLETIEINHPSNLMIHINAALHSEMRQASIAIEMHEQQLISMKAQQDTDKAVQAAALLDAEKQKRDSEKQKQDARLQLEEQETTERAKTVKTEGQLREAMRADSFKQLALHGSRSALSPDTQLALSTLFNVIVAAKEQAIINTSDLIKLFNASPEKPLELMAERSIFCLNTQKKIDNLKTLYTNIAQQLGKKESKADDLHQQKVRVLEVAKELVGAKIAQLTMLTELYTAEVIALSRMQPDISAKLAAVQVALLIWSTRLLVACDLNPKYADGLLSSVKGVVKEITSSIIPSDFASILPKPATITTDDNAKFQSANAAVPSSSSAVTLAVVVPADCRTPCTTPRSNDSFSSVSSATSASAFAVPGEVVNQHRENISLTASVCLFKLIQAGDKKEAERSTNGAVPRQ